MVSQWIEQECRRCHGTGRVATKGTTTAVLCSCPAGRQHAADNVRVFFFPPQKMVARG